MKEKMLEKCLMMFSWFEAIKSKTARYLKNEVGASTVEYALVIGVVVLLVIGAASVLDTPLRNFFKAIVDKITNFGNTKQEFK